MPANSYKYFWEKYEKNFLAPTRSRKIIIRDYDDFKNKVLEENVDFVKNTVKSLFDGDFYILKSAFSKKFMEDLKINTFNYFKNKPSEFYKMLEGTPDFHRKIDLKTGEKYSFKLCKHSFYFYPWNSDPLDLFKSIYPKWRIIKKLMGLEMNEYESNTPKDGVIDRIQVVQYPSSIGYLEPHADPYKYQRLIFSGYMSKRGIDYEQGGFYLVSSGDEVKEVEDLIDIGDVGIGYATVYHGIAPVNRNRKPDWKNVNDGRWFLSMYSNESDEVKNRHTSYSVNKKLSIKGVLPIQIENK